MRTRLDVSEALQVLGVSPSTDLAGVTRRFRKLAREHHPDHGGDAPTFQRLELAFRVVRRAHERGELPRARPPQPTRGAPGFMRERPRHVDVDSVDWSQELPGPGRAARLDRDLLAVAVRTDMSVAARSRGRHTPLNLVTPLLSSDLTATILVVRSASSRAEITLTLRRGAIRDRLLEVDLPAAWSRVRENRTVMARRTVAGDEDPRVTALRTVEAVTDVLDALDWPLSRWWLERET